jgi:hemerythrin
MAIAWTAALAVGVEEIDSQHKELFIRLNSLLVAMREGQGKNEIAKTLKFLEDYVVEHFGAEDKLMVKYGYPIQAAQAHRKEHADFVRTFGELKTEAQSAAGAGPTFVLKLQRTVCDWLLSHIGKTDLALGQFLKTQTRGLARTL